MKIKTSDLTDAALDGAVDKAEGHIRPDGGYYCGQHGVSRRYSTDWAQGGPIIERMPGFILRHEEQKTHPDLVWVATLPWPNRFNFGPTPLIAAMRCYVASRLGDEVDIPDELL